MADSLKHGERAEQEAGKCPMRFDPLSEEQLEDPYPIYRRLQDEAPVFYEPAFDLYVVSRYDDVVAVAKDHETFSSRDAVRTSVEDPHPRVKAELENGYPPAATLTDSDEPLHRRLRGLVNKAFTHRRVAELEPTIEGFTNELIEGFEADGEAELIERFAWPLPMMVIAEMLGCPRSDVERLHRWSYDWLRLIQATDPVDRQVEYARSYVKLQHYTMEQLEMRMNEPGDDLMSALLEARVEGEEPLSIEEAMRVPLNLIIAGHVTVTRAIANSLDYLFRDPASQERLTENPSEIPGAVEELLRLESPGQGFFRTATRDTEIAGVRIPSGARVMIHFAAANRDDRVFECPEQLDPDRSELMRHLAFGKGIHACVGAPLARLELRIALEALLRRLPGLRPDPEREAVRDTIFFARGFTSFPVRWDEG